MKQGEISVHFLIDVSFFQPANLARVLSLKTGGLFVMVT